MDDEEIAEILENEVKRETTPPHIESIYFYGAGCRPDQVERMSGLLRSALRAKSAEVHSDLLGAARALCGHSAGIVSILGTGSGSAVFDGQRFTQQTPSLGFILGDEGSGAVLGRRLVSDVFKRQLPSHILTAFEQEQDADISEVIRRVYREASPNRYLARFTHFLSAHKDDEAVRRLVVNEFRRFFARNIRNYSRPDLATNFVGSIAAVFEEELRCAASLEGYAVGRILRSPIEALSLYHQQQLQ